MKIFFAVLVAIFVFQPNSFATDNESCRQYLGSHLSNHLTNEKTAQSHHHNEEPQLDPQTSKALVDRYGIDPKEVHLTPNTKIPVILRKTGHETLTPEMPTAPPIREMKEYDVIIVGSGPAALTSAVYLTDQGKKVLMVERENELGGLATGSKLHNVLMGVGAAYSAGPTGIKQYNIFRHIGIGDYKKRFGIYDSIDSLLVNGEVVEDIWEDHALAKINPAYALFKEVLVELARGNYKDERLIQGNAIKHFYMDEYVRKFPEFASRSRSLKVRAAYKRFLEDPRVSKIDPMKPVLDFLDLYGRSALGGNTTQVPARRFCYFYASELKKRFTGALGTGFITEALLSTLKKGQRDFEIRVSAPVARVENIADGALVTYVKNGHAFTAKAKKVIFSAAMTLAPKLIKDFEKLDPEKAKAISEIKMTDYSVHVVHVKGHPYRQTYDLWMRPDDYTEEDPTDVINGRWMDPKIRGYEGMRDFKKDPEDDYGILTGYDAIGLSENDNYTYEHSLLRTERFAKRLHDNLDPIVAKDGQKIEIQLIESYRWPYAIHRVDLNHDRHLEIFKRSMGNIEFANNTMVVPEIESSMELGYDAAMKILGELANDTQSRIAP